MSVYTSINHLQLNDLLNYYRLGKLINFEGIEAGIENTNYRFETTTGYYILTIFESLDAQELPFFFDLLQHYQQAGVSCPTFQIDCQGHRFRGFNSKPVAIFVCINGKSLITPTRANCAEIGAELGKIHRAGANFSLHRKNPKGSEWIRKTAEQLQSQLNTEEKTSINDYFINQLQVDTLPRGVIHGDLFKDNSLFFKGKLSGVLDFYLACEDDLLLDLAITVNDWCYHQGQLDHQKMNALLSAYQQLRPLEKCEKQSWSVMLQKAALRFWLARLKRQSDTQTAQLTLQKDPNTYKKIFLSHLNNPIKLI
ncbi:MAG: homoserine kinase [Methylococcales bacterium]|nr:homoserine kinase [Methylococcales bacterium]MCK5924443.1 homoserine kinase [Methylococcales bacterium]